MKKLAPNRLLAALLAISLACLTQIVWADKVTLKNGEVLEGEIVDEEGDTLKIKVTQGTIKSTREIPKGEIESIEKPKPDDVEFEKIQQLLPTPSLLGPNDYRERRELPAKFLVDFSDSKHKGEVEKILQELNDELAKVEQGYIKLAGEWITPEERKAHQTNIDAQIAVLQMRQKAQIGGTNGSVAALRDFGDIEDKYTGTTAYPDAVEVARQVLPFYYRTLNNQLKDLKIRTEQQKTALERLTPTARAAHEKAVAEENARFVSRMEAEKNAGAIWLSTHRDNEASLVSAIDQIEKENARLEKFDLVALRAQADALYEVETLIGKEELDAAEAKLKEALNLKGSGSKTKSKNPFIAGIQVSLEEARDKAKAIADLAERGTTDSARLADRIASTATDPAAPPAAADPATPADPAAEPVEGAKPAPPSAKDDLAAAFMERTSAAKAKPAEAAPAPKKSKTPAKDKPKVSSSSGGGGGGFPMSIVFILVPIIMVGATAFIYLQDKKKKEQG